MTGNDLRRQQLAELTDGMKNAVRQALLLREAQRAQLIDFLDRLHMILDGILQREGSK